MLKELKIEFPKRRRRSRELAIPKGYSPKEEFAAIGQRCLQLAMHEDNFGRQRSVIVPEVAHKGWKDLELNLIATFIKPPREDEMQLDGIRAHWLTPTLKTIDHNAIFSYELETEPASKLYADLTVMNGAIKAAEVHQGLREAD